MKTALVTGANRGIGLAVAEGLAAAGLRVILGCRSTDEGDAAASALASKKHIQAQAIGIDLSDPASIDRALAELVRAGIEIDVLVNNAGVYHRGDSFSVAIEDVRQSMEVHFFGPLLLCRGLIPGMVSRGYGRVVNVSSGYGALSDGLAGDAAYSLSKAALNALTVKLAAEVHGDVKINAACPGWVRTRMGGDGADRSVDEGADTIVWLATLPASGPHGGFFRDRAPIAW